MPIPMSSRQIADDLTARIRGREYQPGEKLPSLRELADLYSVSVSTIQRALELTRDRGLTVGRPGAGVYVVRIAEDDGGPGDWDTAAESPAWISRSTGDDRLHVTLPAHLLKTTAFRVRLTGRLSADAPVGRMPVSSATGEKAGRTVPHDLAHRLRPLSEPTALP